MKDNLIGLKRFTVELKPHHTKWEDIFIETKELLQRALHDHEIEIEHIGSTSIEGLVAKPIIDIAIGMTGILKIDKVIVALEANGFVYKGDSGENGGHLFVQDREEDIRTHHIHVIDIKDEQWANYLRFRDALRENKTLRQGYQDLKKDLEKRFKYDRRSYTNGKEDFIRMVLKNA